MKNRLNGQDVLVMLTIILLVIITLAGLLSFQTDQSYAVTNQYGHEVVIFGSGVYAHDSFFRAPIFIGSDATMLFLVVPLLTIALIRKIRLKTEKSKLFLTTVLGVTLYYACSITFGITYNSFHLLYIALFSCSLFAFILSFGKISKTSLPTAQTWALPAKAVSVFLILSGIALFIAWLPDIIPTIIAGTTLPLIEVYTTEITYALDMGIISPLMFACYYLLKRQNGTGYALLPVMLLLCVVMGVMLPVQTVFQTLAGIETPIPVLVIKVGIFVVLAVFAAIFNFKFYRHMQD